MSDNFDFMEEVQKYDYIYNKYSCDYKNKFMKYNCWQTIVSKFDLTPKDAEKTFQNIRTAYRRHVKKRKTLPSGLGRDAFPIAPRKCQNLEWLGSLICHQETISNYKCDSDKSHAVITENVSEEDEQSPVSELDEDQQTQELTIPTDEGESKVDKDGSKFDDEGDFYPCHQSMRIQNEKIHKMS